MTVGFQVKYYWYQVGTGSFLYSFFSTICYHLEDKKWGSQYPYLMKQLYQGQVGPEDLDSLKKEVVQIKNRLTNYSPHQVVWDINDLDKKPPWGSDISDSITNLSKYFVTSDGEDLFKILLNAIDKANKLNYPLDTFYITKNLRYD